MTLARRVSGWMRSIGEPVVFGFEFFVLREEVEVEVEVERRRAISAAASSYARKETESDRIAPPSVESPSVQAAPSVQEIKNVECDATRKREDRGARRENGSSAAKARESERGAKELPSLSSSIDARRRRPPTPTLSQNRMREISDCLSFFLSDSDPKRQRAFVAASEH